MDSSKSRSSMSNEVYELAKLSPWVLPKTDVSAVTRIDLKPLQSRLSLLQYLLKQQGMFLSWFHTPEALIFSDIIMNPSHPY